MARLFAASLALIQVCAVLGYSQPPFSHLVEFDNCAVQAYVRAQDLSPGTVSQGQLRIIRNSTCPSDLTVALELRYDESLMTAYSLNTSIVTGEEEDYDIGYDYWDPEKFFISGAHTTVFSSKLQFSENSIENFITNFTIHSSSTRYPGSFEAYGWSSDGDGKAGLLDSYDSYSYLVHITTGLESKSATIGRTAFVPTNEWNDASPSSVEPMKKLKLPLTCRRTIYKDHSQSMEHGKSCFTHSASLAHLPNIEQISAVLEAPAIARKGSDLLLKLAFVDQNDEIISGPSQIDAQYEVKTSVPQKVLQQYVPATCDTSTFQSERMYDVHELNSQKLYSTRKQEEKGVYGYDDDFRVTEKQSGPLTNIEFSVRIPEYTPDSVDKLYMQIESMISIELRFGSDMDDFIREKSKAAEYKDIDELDMWTEYNDSTGSNSESREYTALSVKIPIEVYANSEHRKTGQYLEKSAQPPILKADTAQTTTSTEMITILLSAENCPDLNAGQKRKRFAPFRRYFRRKPDLVGVAWEKSINANNADDAVVQRVLEAVPYAEVSIWNSISSFYNRFTTQMYSYTAEDGLL